MSESGPGVGFALRMAVRELRSSARKLSLFFVAVSIGVAAIVVLRSVADSVQAALANESRFLLAADVTVSSSEGLDPETLAVLDLAVSDYPLAGEARSARVATLARSGSDELRAAMVELKGVDDAFPLYGEMEIAGGNYDPRLLSGRGALTRPEVRARLGLDIGDEILLGGEPFRIRGDLLKEPGAGINFFRRGPRVLVGLSDLLATGLLDTPGRGREEALLAVRDEGKVEDLAAGIRTALEDAPVRVRTYRQIGDRAARGIRRGEDYLSLAGFVILVLGGIGVFSVARTFVRQGLPAAAVERCLGVPSRTILLIALFQMAALAGLASLFGIAVSAVALRFLVPPVEIGGIAITARLTATAALQGALTGGGVALLAAVFPLLPLRRVRPLGLLRSGDFLDTRGSARTRRTEAAAAAGAVAAFFGLAGWQSGSLPIALAVTGGFLVVAAVLWVLGGLLLRALGPLAAARSFAVRHAVRTVLRGARQMRVVLVAIGVGVFLVMTTVGIEENLQRTLSFEEERDAPDLFFLDIQADQVERIRANAAASGAPDINLIPVLQARIHGIFGEKTTYPDREAVRRAGGLAREYTVSSRSWLEDNEELVAGEFWGERPAEGIEVSADIELLDEHGVGVGDTIRFRILGEHLDARITSLRDIEWQNARNGGFTFLFHPDNLRDFPMTYAGFVRGPDAPLDRARFQGAVIGAFPNVTVVDLRDVLDTMRQVAGSVALAVRIVGLISLAGGLLILIGTVAVHIGARRRETAVLRVFGVGRWRVVAITLLEHGAMGAVAGGAAGAAAAATTLVVVGEIMRMDFVANPLLGAVALLAPAVGAAVVGGVAAADVLRKKPLRVLAD